MLDSVRSIHFGDVNPLFSFVLWQQMCLTVFWEYAQMDRSIEIAVVMFGQETKRLPRFYSPGSETTKEMEYTPEKADESVCILCFGGANGKMNSVKLRTINKSVAGVAQTRARSCSGDAPTLGKTRTEQTNSVKFHGINKGVAQGPALLRKVSFVKTN